MRGALVALVPPLALSLALSLASRSAAASDADPWFGPDKALHFAVSAGLAAGGYAAVSPWLESRTERALAGSALSLTLGASKELWDLAGHGDPSWRDFTWDVLGTALGVALAVSVDALASRGKEAPAQHTAHGLLIHF
jgi:putative lipoprotein